MKREEVFMTHPNGKMIKDDKKIVARRMIAIICRQYRYTLNDIGRIFGGQDHTTILNLTQKAEDYLEVDKKFKEDYDSILAKLNVKEAVC
jgi:chromosomal replication initiation ATPase DnaA